MGKISIYFKKFVYFSWEVYKLKIFQPCRPTV